MKRLLILACVALTACEPRPLSDGDMALRREARAQEVRDRARADCDTLHQWGEACPAEPATNSSDEGDRNAE
jgi:hypothetical protein